MTSCKWTDDCLKERRETPAPSPCVLELWLKDSGEVLKHEAVYQMMLVLFGRRMKPTRGLIRGRWYAIPYGCIKGAVDESAGCLGASQA